MLENLHKGMDILGRQPGADEQHIALLQKRFPTVPQDYVDLAREATDLELATPNGRYLRLWGPMGTLDMDEGYEISSRIPGAIPIGDDGSGKVLFFANGHEGHGLYRVGYGDLDMEDAEWIAESLSALIFEGRGAESF
jgi:hypothetical protein